MYEKFFGFQRPPFELVPDPDFLHDWSKSHGKSGELREVAADAGLHEAISQAIERVNADLSQFERVRRFMIAPEAFGVENGMMTPTMKIRRHIIKEGYGTDLEALYG